MAGPPLRPSLSLSLSTHGGRIPGVATRPWYIQFLSFSLLSFFFLPISASFSRSSLPVSTASGSQRSDLSRARMMHAGYMVSSICAILPIPTRSNSLGVYSSQDTRREVFASRIVETRQSGFPFLFLPRALERSLRAEKRTNAFSAKCGI